MRNKNKDIKYLNYQCMALLNQIEGIEYHAELNHRELTGEEEEVIEELQEKLDQVNKLRKEIIRKGEKKK